MMQNAVPDALQALMVLARQASPTTPDGAPTVAAQLAQMAAPQGVAQGMPQAVQDFEASAPSVMRNMQQDQIQRMVRQAMQPQPAGIEGLPAPNMQFAEGGVIGFAGPDGSEVPEAESPLGRMFQRGKTSFAEAGERERLRRQLAQQYGPASALPGLLMSQTDAQRERAKEIMRMLPTMSVEQMRNLLGQTPARTVSPAAWEGAGPGESPVTPEVVNANYGNEGRRVATTPPVASGTARTAGGPPRPAPAPQAPAAQAPAAPAAVPPGGIAQTLPAAPTINAALTQVEQMMPGSGTADSRKALEDLQRMRKERPDSGIATLKALEEEGRTQAAIAKELDESKQARGTKAWLQGGARLGSSGRAVAAFEEGERQRRMLFAQQNTIRIGKMDAIKEANEARRIGDQEKYVEALNKIRELDRADQQIKAQLAAQVLNAGITARGQDITAGTAAADREAAAARLERQIQAQASEGRLDRASREAIAKIAQQGAETPAEIRLMEWLKKPENKDIYEEVMGIRQMPKTRQELAQEWGKSVMLQQRYPNMDDYIRAATSTGAPSGAKLKYNPATGQIE